MKMAAGAWFSPTLKGGNLTALPWTMSWPQRPTYLPERGGSDVLGLRKLGQKEPCRLSLGLLNTRSQNPVTSPCGSPGIPLKKVKAPHLHPQLSTKLTANAHLPALGGNGLRVFLAKLNPLSKCYVRYTAVSAELCPGWICDRD